MAIEDIALRLKLSATGVQEQVDNSQQIANNYARATANAEKLGAANARAAAYSGSRSTRETVEYGMARGAAGSTGASARDFANQAQGLGGLVRLYATYAANVFAVTAAFRALSDAMNTANMVRGLDQLGAASGRALGNLSKQLVEVTDGAISFRDAMTAVAQTSSAGMSSQNILRLGAAAQKASQALGLNMADALNRLSRGITKLEPELLDELGVFIRIDDAAEKYARTLGKTVGSLTEFERRQGFALAVLDQVEEKFSKIKLDTNPYDKLAASLDNLTKKVLDFINIGLGPVVNFLAQSQAALGAALLGLGTIVLRQALPVLTQYREGLRKTREASLAMAAETSGELAKQQINNMKKALQATYDIEDKKIEAADAAQKKYEALQQKYAKDERKTFDARIKSILAKQAADVTSEDLAYIDKKATQTEKANKKMANSYKEISSTLNDARVAALTSEEARKNIADAELAYNQKYGNSLQKNIDLRQQLTKAARDDIAVKTATAVKDQGYFSALKTGFSQVLQQRKELAVDIPILGDAGKKTGQTSKLVVGGLSAMETALAGVRVAASATGQFFAGLLSRLGTIGIVVSIGVAAFEVFNSILSDSEKQAEAFRKSQDLLTGSIKNVGDTLEAISKKKPDQILSVESIQARANAFNDLSDSLIKTTADFNNLINAQNGWNKGLDATARFFGKTLGEWGKGLAEGPLNGLNQIIGGLAVLTSKISEAIFGKGAQAEFSDKFAESIIAALAVAESELEKQKLTELLQNILGPVDLTNLEKLKAGVNALGVDELKAKSELAAKAIKKISDESNNSASILTSLRESIKTVSKEIDGLNTSLLPTDRLGKIGVGFIDTSNNLLKALDDTKNSIVAIKEISDSMQLVSLLPADTATSLLKDKKEIADITTKLGEAREAVRNYKLELAKNTGDTDAARARRTELRGLIRTEETSIQDLDNRAAAITRKYGVELQRVIFEEGVQKLNASLKFGLEQAAINAAKAYVGVLGQVGGATAQEETKLALQELSIQKRLIEEQYQSRLALERNTLALEKSTTAQEITALNAKIAGQRTGATTEDTTRYQKLMEKRQTLEEKQTLLDDPNIKKLEQARKDGSEYQKRAAMELGGLTSVIFGKQIQLAQIAGQEAQVLAQGLLKSERELADQANKRIDLSLKDNQAKLDELTTNQNLLGIYDSGLASQRLSLETTILQQNAQKELNKLVADESILQQLKGKPGVNEKKREEALLLVLGQKAALSAKYIQDDTNLRKKARFDDFKNIEEIAKKERENSLQILQANNEVSNTRLDASLQYLQVLEAFGVQDKISAVQQRAKIDLLKEELQFNAQLIDLNNRQLSIDSKRGLIALLQKEGVDATGLVKEADREQALLNAQRDSILAGNEARKESVRLQAEQNIKLEQQNYFLEQASKLSNNLNENFGKTGARLGQAIDTLSKITQNIEAGRIAQESWNRRAAEFGDFPPPEFIEEGTRLQKKAAQDELDRNAMALNSTKKLFKEKTAAYKTFGALEKAYHITRLIMNAKDIAAQIAQTVSFVTSSITRQGAAAAEAGVLGVKAVINAMSVLPPPLNYAAGAAMTAIVAGLLAQIGKSFRGGGGSTGPSVADVVKVQGTGQEYDASGKLVNTGTGVYGDPTAVADSVKSSMDTLSKNFFGLLGSGNSPVVKALKSIETNTGETVKALIGEGISGFAGNTMSRFGTKVGTESTTAWYNLWSGSTTKTEILAAGFELKGTFDQVSKIAVDGLNNLGQSTSGAAIRLFEDIKTTTKGKFLGVTIPFTKDVDYDTKFTAATQALVKAVTGTVTSVGNAIVAAAEAIDGSGQQAQTILKNFDFGIRLVTTGLTAEEALQKLTGEISKKLNALTLAVTPWITEFVQNGEEYFETAARIAKGSEVVRDGLYILGETLGTFGTTVERVRVEQKLIEAAGGLEEFASAVTYFEERFLTEQERVALKQTRLVEQLTNGNKDLAKNLGLSKQVFEQLGFGAVDSTYELKALIQSFQVTDDASALLKAELLKLAPAMYEVYSEVEKFNIQLGVENIKLASTLTPLQQSLREILTTASTELEKYRDNGANLLSVVNNVRLKFLSAIKSSFKSAYDDRQKEITGTLDALKRVKESFTSLQKELLRGAQSTSTPVEKFNILFSEYKQALVDIQSTDTKVSDAAKQAFPNLAKEVLQSASELYSSSEMYTKIFDQVSRDVGSASDFIDQQISDQEKLLNELDSKYKPILDDISANTKTSADKLEEAYDLWNRSLGSKQTLTAADIQTFVNALKNKDTPAVKALADFFKLTDPGTAALAISVEALAVDFEQFARGLVEAAKTSMGELGANSLTAIRAAAVANKPADGGDGGDGGRGGDGGNGGIITIGPDGKVTSTIVGETGDTGRGGEAGSTGGTTSSTTSTLLAGELDPAFVADEYGTGGEVITLGDRTGGATIGGDTVRGREVDSVAAQASQALQDYEDMLTDYGTLGMNTDQLESVSSLLTDEGLGGILTSGNLNDTAGITLGTHRYNEFSNTNDVNAGFGANVSEFGDGVIGASEAINQASTALTTASNNLTTAANATLVDNAASLATMMVLNEANTALTVTNSLGLQTASQLVSAGTELVLSAIQAGQELMNNFSSQSIPYASFWRSGGVDYGKNWDEWNDWNDGLSGRASGGPVTANTPYMVGEVGPELFVPSTNGTIVPNNELSFNNQEIVAKLDQLIQAVSQGAVINVRATKENTECIEQAIMNNNNTIRAQSRVGIK